MTFAEYWKEHEPFGSDPEDVAKLAWDAAICAERERCAKIALTHDEECNEFSQCAEIIAAKIREEKA